MHTPCNVPIALPKLLRPSEQNRICRQACSGQPEACMQTCEPHCSHDRLPPHNFSDFFERDRISQPYAHRCARSNMKLISSNRLADQQLMLLPVVSLMLLALPGYWPVPKAVLGISAVPPPWCIPRYPPLAGSINGNSSQQLIWCH